MDNVDLLEEGEEIKLRRDLVLQGIIIIKDLATINRFAYRENECATYTPRCFKKKCAMATAGIRVYGTYRRPIP